MPVTYTTTHQYDSMTRSLATVEVERTWGESPPLRTRHIISVHGNAQEAIEEAERVAAHLTKVGGEVPEPERQDLPLCQPVEDD